MGPLAVNASDLTYHWPGQRSVLDIEALSVRQGERVFIEGPSGSGKSTLLALLSGIIPPSSGSLSVLGANFSTMSTSKRDRFRADRLGIIFQMFNLVTYLSVLDNVLLPCRFSPTKASNAGPGKKAQRETAIALLSQLGLSTTDLQRRKVSALSVGQQQRVAAARALIGAPSLVLADEPTSALDAANRDSFVTTLLDGVSATGATLLFVSHDRGLADQFDRTLSLPDLNQAVQEGAE